MPSIIQISVANDGSQANQLSYFGSLSTDARFAIFQSPATNLVTSDINNANDIFVRDTCIGAPAGCAPSTIRLPVGGQPNGNSFHPVITANGLLAAFSSSAGNLVAGAPQGGIFIAPMP
jgi:hypothetical protein